MFVVGNDHARLLPPGGGGRQKSASSWGAAKLERRLAAAWQALPLVFEREPDLDGHLPGGDLIVLDCAACLNHLEPTELLALARADSTASSIELGEVPVNSMSLYVGLDMVVSLSV
jgi:hypothetical protein